MLANSPVQFSKSKSPKAIRASLRRAADHSRLIPPQIEVAGLAFYPLTERKLAQGQPVVVSITGGTGKYIGVTGEVQTTHLPDGTFEHVFTFVTR